MDKTIRKLYTPPLVVQTVGVLLERAFLAGSVPVETALVIDTTSQEVDHTDFSGDDFNFEWE